MARGDGDAANCRDSVVRVSSRARNANLVFSGRNLHSWTKYRGTDPESDFTATGGGDAPSEFQTFAAADDFPAPPQPRLLTLRPLTDMRLLLKSGRAVVATLALASRRRSSRVRHGQDEPARGRRTRHHRSVVRAVGGRCDRRPQRRAAAAPHRHGGRRKHLVVRRAPRRRVGHQLHVRPERRNRSALDRS